jgi:hypothetical protein
MQHLKEQDDRKKEKKKRKSIEEIVDSIST